MSLQLGALACLILAEWCDNHAHASFGIDLSTPTMYRVWVEKGNVHHSVFVAVDEEYTDTDINEALAEAAYRLTQSDIEG